MSRLAILVAIAVGACGISDPATIDPRVRVLEHDPGIEMTVEPDLLSFPRTGNDALLSLVPDDILVSGEGAGFVRKVVDVSQTTDAIVVRTVEAQLSDAVIDGAGTDTLTPPEPEGKADGIEGLVTFNTISFLGNSTVSAKIIDGYMSFKPNLDLDFDIENRRITKFNAVATGALNGKLVFEVRTAGAASLRQERELWTSPPKAFVQMVGVVPVVEIVTMSIGVGIEVQTSGATYARVGGKLSGRVAAGARYSNGSWRTVNDRAVTFTAVQKTLEGNVETTITVYTYAQLSCAFYGIVGPYVQVTPYVGMVRPPSAAAYGTYGLAGQFGGQVAIGSNALVGIEKELFNWDAKF